MRRRSHSANAKVSYWRSYSDMMAALLLMFVLMMAFVMFTSADTYEKKQAEITLQRAQMQEQQLLLTEQEKQLAEQTQLLEGQQERLAHQQSLLSTQENLLNSQQSQLATQKDQLIEQQLMIEDIIGVRTRLIKQISQRLKQANIATQIDPATGAITFGSNVLFEFNKYKLTPEGSEFLQKFLPVYFNALLGSGFDDYVSEIIIEGHTDTLGDYMYNLELSQQRAFEVASFCLDEKNQLVDAAMLEKLRSIVTANGRSMSQPVKNADGTVNMDASRRVEIKFRLKDEEMVQDMQSILEG